MKRLDSALGEIVRVSPPARGRGLKLERPAVAGGAQAVAPRAGAWIETTPGSTAGSTTTSPPARGRGLKQGIDRGLVILRTGRPPRGGVD